MKPGARAERLFSCCGPRPISRWGRAMNDPERETERVDLRLSPELSARLKEQAARSDRDVEEIARDLLSRGLSAGSRDEKSPETVRRETLPDIEAPETEKVTLRDWVCVWAVLLLIGVIFLGMIVGIGF